MLTETARSEPGARRPGGRARDGDPTVGALLLGKAAQARERGVDWTRGHAAGDSAHARSARWTPYRSSATSIDNAIDAAAAGPEPRWVRVGFAPAPRGALALTFSDSGTGVPADTPRAHLRARLLTKPAGAEGRGVGLALVRAIAGRRREAASSSRRIRRPSASILPAQVAP